MTNNEELFATAQRWIPGGVNSPVRAFRAVGGTPKFIQRAQGPFMWDAENNRYIDYIGSWGAAILGHAHPEVLDVVQQTAAKGFSFGAPTELEIEIAKTLCTLIPSMEQVRFVNSGTEATMSALRLARGYTKRSKIIKFEGCYHGHADALLVKAGSGLLTFGNPTSAGVPAEVAQDTIVLSFNNSEQLNEVFAKFGELIAAVIVEPIAGNMNFLRADPAFLKTMRELCTQYEAVLIFDEVMSGFRVALGGAQALYGIRPDLSTFGKIIGGGLPAAAFGGRKEIMQKLAPVGDVYQAGTLSGNPLAMAAGLKTLELLQVHDFYKTLSQRTHQLLAGLSTAAHAVNINFCADAVGGMFGFYFLQDLPKNFEQIQKNPQNIFKYFFHAMLKRGVYFAPSAFEAGFVSIQHDEKIIDETIAIAQQVFTELANDRTLAV